MSQLIAKGLFGGLFHVACLGALLLIPAALLPGGTWFWPRALLFLGVYGVLVFGAIVVLAVKAPASLTARLRRPVSRKQPVADRIVTSFLVLTSMGFFALLPIDALYLKLLPPPGFIVSSFGGVLFVLGFAIAITATYQNSFAIPIVEDQTEVGQTLVDTGLYAVVRHPLYLGMLLFTAGMAMWLESYAGLVAVSLIMAVLIARIAVEEKLLSQTLPGYTEYMQRVPYRLVPLAW